MIYGPKNDGTYVVSLERRRAKRWASRSPEVVAEAAAVADGRPCRAGSRKCLPTGSASAAISRHRAAESANAIDGFRGSGTKR
jgi:hypothetical protein